MGDISELANSIKEQGLLQPIGINDNNELIFGQRRIEAAISLGWEEIEVRRVNVTSILEGELTENEVRKQFNIEERVAIGKAVEDLLGERRGGDRKSEQVKNQSAEFCALINNPQVEENQSANVGTLNNKTQIEKKPADICVLKKNIKTGIETRDIAAKKAGFGSHDTYTKAKTIIDKATPEQLKKVNSGESSINEVYTKIKIAAKKEEVIEKLNSIETIEVKKTEGVFDVIVIDPPWPMKKIERNVAPNQVLFDYPVMSIEDIKNLNIPCADDCHVWLWTTQKFLPVAFECLEAWNLKYVCTFVWHKPGGFQVVNLPQYNAEFVLYARHGAPTFTTTKAFSTCFNASRGRHSEKPEEFYDMVRRVTAGRRLDMFNRKAIDGFETWGKEAK